MSNRLPTLTSRKVIKALQKLGFEKVRQKGSHVMLKHPSGAFTVVPHHKGEDLGRGMVKSILKEANVSLESFRKV